MLAGDLEKTSTKWPKDFLYWKMVWWVKGLMNNPILKAATNVVLLRTHERGRGNIRVERKSRRQEYSIVIRECTNKRQRFTKGTEARGSNTRITTPTPDVSRRPGENLHQVAQGMPPYPNGLVGEGLNEPPNSQGCNQCGIITHTHEQEKL